MEEENKVPKFDLERLAKDIDKLFQNKLKGNINSFEQEVEYHKEDFGKVLKEDLLKHKNSVKLAVASMKEDILAEISKGRTTIVSPQSLEINIEHTDHPKMEDVIASLILHKKAMLVGPAGTGKTYMVAETATRMEVPFYKYSCSRDSSVHDLLGYKQPKSETYLETSFLQAYEKGGIFLVDEYDAMSGDMALFFNGIADNSKFISIPHRDDNPTALKHKDFYLVMCGNTWGKGSTDYSGRDFQDMALMDRFRFCRHHIGYHFELEKTWMGDNFSFMTKLRSTLEGVGSYLSTRNVEDISNLLATNITKEKIVEMISQDLGEEDQKSVKTVLKPTPLSSYSSPPQEALANAFQEATRRQTRGWEGQTPRSSHSSF